MSAMVTPLGHDQEGWRSIDADGALHFRMRHDGGAIVCVVPRPVLLTLPGVRLRAARRTSSRPSSRTLPASSGIGQREVRRGRMGERRDRARRRVNAAPRLRRARPLDAGPAPLPREALGMNVACVMASSCLQPGTRVHRCAAASLPKS